MALTLPIPARSLGLEMMGTSEVQPEVNPVAWQEVGRRIAGAFSRAIAEDDSDDEWMPLRPEEQEPEPEQEVTPEAHEEAAWAEVGRRLAGAFSAALAEEDSEEEDEWQAPRDGAAGGILDPSRVEVFCGGAGAAAKGASPALSAVGAQATPATLPSTAPGTAAPSEVEPSEAASDSEELSASGPAFAAVLSLRLEDIRAHQPEQRLANTDSDDEDDRAERVVDPAREEAAFRGLVGRIARVFEDASDSDEE